MLLISLAAVAAVVLPLFLSFGITDLDVIAETISNPSFARIAIFTVKQALISTILAMIVGLPAAIYYARSRGVVSRLLGITTYIPFFFPGISMAIGFLSVYGRNGLLNDILNMLGLQRVQLLYTFGAILLGHVFYNAPIVVLILGNALRKIPLELIENSKIDGAGRMRMLFNVELPLVTPALVNSALLIFSYCFTSFAVVLILGGAQFATLEVSIYMYFRLLGRPQAATVLALVQFLFIVLFGVFILLTERKVQFEYGDQFTDKGTVIRGYSVLFLMFEWLPIVGAFATSVYDWNRGELIFSRIFTLFSGRIASIGTTLASTLFNSLFLSFLAGNITSSISFALALRARTIPGGAKHLKVISLIALSVTPSMLAISYLSVLDFIPVPLLMVMLYTVLSLPIALNYMNGQVQSVELSFIEAASLDGATRFSRFRYIIFPLFRGSLLYASTIVFAISMGEFGGSLILGAQDFPTFTVAIYRL
ncbi:MAG: ABC transporter permease, partial [Kosmotogaceae bacterium]